MVSNLLWVVLGAAIAAAAARLRVGSWSNPGPGFVPLLTGVVILGLGLSVVAEEWWERRRAAPPPAAPTPRVSPAPVVLALAGLLAYAMLLERAGYVLTTLAFMAFALRVLGGLRWAPVLLTSIVATAGSYALFSLWLRVPLPPWPRGF